MNMRKKITITGIVLGTVMLILLLTYEIKQETSSKAWNLPLSGKVIVIDPGHGGIDGGAAVSGVMEKHITLSVSKRLRDYFQEQGALVLMTREKDEDLADEGSKSIRQRKRTDLHNRANFINDSEADLFISVHVNAFPEGNSKGAQTFYSPRFKENEQVAKLIQAELISNLQNTHRQAKPLGNVYLVKHAEKPGVLVELGFISNKEERANLQKKTYQDDLALSIYSGVIRYFLGEEAD